MISTARPRGDRQAELHAPTVQWRQGARKLNCGSRAQSAIPSVAIQVDGLRAEVALLALVEHVFGERLAAISPAIIFKQQELQGVLPKSSSGQPTNLECGGRGRPRLYQAYRRRRFGLCKIEPNRHQA